MKIQQSYSLGLQKQSHFALLDKVTQSLRKNRTTRVNQELKSTKEETDPRTSNHYVIGDEAAEEEEEEEERGRGGGKS